MEVFQSVVKKQIEGNELEIHLATFIEAEKLLGATIKGYKEDKLDMDLVFDKTFQEALLPCLKKCFWNKEPINDWSFFDKVTVRPYFFEICTSVMEENNKPFMSRLLSSSTRASQETETNIAQK